MTPWGSPRDAWPIRLGDKLKSVRRISTAGASEFVDDDEYGRGFYQDLVHGLFCETCFPHQQRELAIAVWVRRQRDVTGRRSAAVFHTTSRNHGDLAKSDREAKRCPVTN